MIESFEKPSYIEELNIIAAKLEGDAYKYNQKLMREREYLHSKQSVARSLKTLLNTILTDQI